MVVLTSGVLLLSLFLCTCILCSNGNVEWVNLLCNVLYYIGFVPMIDLEMMTLLGLIRPVTFLTYVLSVWVSLLTIDEVSVLLLVVSVVMLLLPCIGLLLVCTPHNAVSLALSVIGLIRFLMSLYEYGILVLRVSMIRLVRFVTLRVLRNGMLLMTTVLLTLAFMLIDKRIWVLCFVLQRVLLSLRVMMLLITRIGRLATVLNVLQTCRFPYLGSRLAVVTTLLALLLGMLVVVTLTLYGLTFRVCVWLSRWCVDVMTCLCMVLFFREVRAGLLLCSNMAGVVLLLDSWMNLSVTPAFLTLNVRKLSTALLFYGRVIGSVCVC